MEEKELLASPVSILAIDPGISGAVVLAGQGRLEVRRDFKSLADIASAIGTFASGAAAAVIEFVHSRPGEGSVSVFSFGRSTGVAFGSLLSAGFGATKPIEEVHPIRWQNYWRAYLGIPADAEFDSRAICSKILPGFASLFARKKDHGTGDATLLALYRLTQGALAESLCLSPKLLQNSTSSHSRSRAPRVQKA